MFTRFLFKTHESIKVILAILLSVIIITSFSSCAIKNNSEQNHLVYYTLNDKDSLSWIIEKHNKYCINSNNPSFQIDIVQRRYQLKLWQEVDLILFHLVKNCLLKN